MLIASKIKKKMIKQLFNAIKETKKSLVEPSSGSTYPSSMFNVTACQGSAKAYVAAKLFREFASKSHGLAVFSTHTDAIKFMEDLRFFMPDRGEDIHYFPGYHIQANKALGYHANTASHRMALLYRLLEKSRQSIVVTTVDAVIQRIIPRTVLNRFSELVINGDELDRDYFVAKLSAGGYMRTALVEEPGDFAVRGGIVDVFSPNYSNPIRIELFGDYVESLRHFSPISQRGIDEMEEAVIIPPGELILEKRDLSAMVTRLREAGTRAGLDGVKINGYVDKVKESGGFPGLEGLLSIVYPALDSLQDYLSDDTLVILDRPDALRSMVMNHFEQAEETYEAARQEQLLCVEVEKIYMPWDEVLEKADGFITVCFRELMTGDLDDSHHEKTHVSLGFKDNAALTASLQHNTTREKRSAASGNLLTPLAEWLNEKKSSGMAAIAVCGSNHQAGRLNTLLQPYGIEPKLYDGLTFDERLAPDIYYMVGNLSSGFDSPENGFALLTEFEIFGARKRLATGRRKGTQKAKRRFITPEELKTGDIVVHMEHGIGRYEGLKTIDLDGVSGDFILITYKDDDRLYLPVDRMEMIEKYLGVEGYTPLLDKIGGKTWGKARAKARKEVEKMAGELLKLYAERRVGKGFAFSPTDALYDEFQTAFPYEETPDQMRAIEEVLDDMASETPMDRLVCGDVGYGKTEVAIRAAFKAVSDGKQVAVVVPTTILAEQHLHTFRERFKNWPVTIESLSRFRTRKEQGRILSGMAEGTLDLVIGTHRLLQKDIHFKSLGLLIIDEEQRFGVKHKEALKKKRSTVDVLALTATPIPRTLHMSLTGMRDISVIATPPEDRQAIISYICQYDDAVAGDAIKKELARGGQLFFIHNDISSIDEMADHLKKLVPKVRIAVAHGRLPESALEKVMVQFINREVDMLVCTTIVEAGLDIPSANTMIINKADRFGLSQIYQLRGRIGRGEVQAYAYLFVPDEERLSRDARKRLAALMEHRDLGSGFQIAMKDLQIRGAGSALGASQSGHIAAVGYDMFLKLLDEAVSDLKGNPVVPPLEPEINITMSAYIPETYVPSIEQRLTVYRRLSQMTELSEINAMQQELVDRFGKLPEAAFNMLLKIMLRVLGVKAGVKKMDITPNLIILLFSELHQQRPLRVIDRLVIGEGARGLNHGHGNNTPKNSGKAIQKGWPVEFTSENALKIKLGDRNKKIGKALVDAKKILKEIGTRVNV